MDIVQLCCIVLSLIANKYPPSDPYLYRPQNTRYFGACTSGTLQTRNLMLVFFYHNIYYVYLAPTMCKSTAWSMVSGRIIGMNEGTDE